MSNAVFTQNSEEIVEDEADAAAAITPGHLVEYDANGDVQPHATAADPNGARPLFADLPFDPGKDKSDDYAAGERVVLGYVRPGVETDALLAAGETVDPTTPLVSAGDGTLRALDTAGGDDPDAVLAYPTESVDNGGGAEAVRCGIEVVN